MTDIPTITQEEAVEVRARLCALLLDRDGADFDGEVHLTSAEAREVIAGLSPNMDHAVRGVEPFGYWVEQKYAEPALLRKPAYIPKPSDLRTVTPLYRATPPVNQDAVREGARAALRTKVEGIIRDWQRGLPSPRALVDSIMLAIPALATPPLDNTGLDAAAVERANTLAVQAEFLVARIAELDWCGTFDEFMREWNGHVDPPLYRLRQTLASGDRS